MAEKETETDGLWFPELPKLPPFPNMAEIQDWLNLQQELGACLTPLPLLALRMLVLA
jgi:hypothetical protein